MKKAKSEKIKDNNEEVKVNEEAELLKSQLARTLADYDNLVKRVERDRQDSRKLVSANIVMNLLPVLDNLDRAQYHLKDSGLAVSIGEFRRVLTDEGFEEIPIKIGETDFSPLNMEALETVKSDDGSKSGKVAELILSGWRIKNSDPEIIIRPAKVKVFNL